MGAPPPRDPRITSMLADAVGHPVWLDQLGPGGGGSGGSGATEPVRGAATADLVVVGAGFTGLWAAHQALDDDPGRDVLVLEAGGPGSGASWRNGGFCDASLTHGILNGLSRWPQEYRSLHRLGNENLTGLLDDLGRLGIEADWEGTGELDVATAEWQLADLHEYAEAATAAGEEVTVLDAAGVRAEVDSPTFRGGVWRHSNVGLVHPGRLAAGLRAALVARGARISDHTPVDRLEAHGGRVRVAGPGLLVDAGRVLLATNAFRGLLPPLRRAVVPVYDHVLVTEPLTADQRAGIGWRNRQGLGDAANQFHYFRLTPDDRILWGGYDALYSYGGPVGAHKERNEATERLLASQLLECFPQLDGIRITHTWGGPIATTTRFCFTAGTRWDRRVAWAVGYTGLGVGASRFGARVALDLLAGADTERTRLAMVRTAPFPWPPEPLRWAGITLTRRAIARADRNQGRRGPWLRLLDAVGLGFDS